jgi:hypothetical protein
MNLRELEAQADFLAPVIAAAVAKALAPLQEQLSQKEQQIQALHDRINELPAPVTPEPVDLEALAKAAAELITLPEPVPGKDAEPVDLEALAKAAASLVVVPEPVAGKDAEPVDLEALAKAAAALVEIPEPVPGKDAEPVDLAAVAALVEVPKPAEVDMAAVAALVAVPEIDLGSLARAAAALVPAPTLPQPEHGRDALDLEILPAIDEAKQYPRGTYAAHRGGLWKSYERTNGLRGWECIVEGIDSVTVTQDSVREFTVTLSKSSGASAVQKFSLPVQVYKGVHRDGEEYEAHDTVTWGGSVWACKEATTDKPGASEHWQLAVKAGRAGKDLRENASTFDPSKGVKL